MKIYLYQFPYITMSLRIFVAGDHACSVVHIIDQKRMTEPNQNQNPTGKMPKSTIQYPAFEAPDKIFWAPENVDRLDPVALLSLGYMAFLRLAPLHVPQISFLDIPWFWHLLHSEISTETQTSPSQLNELTSWEPISGTLVIHCLASAALWKYSQRFV